MDEALMQTAELSIQGRAVRVHEGGSGPPLLLIHGGWGGALHWSRVWNALAKHHRVVAPDLPGLGSIDTEPLGSVAAYAGWLVELLDRLGIERAICVGNSFGASVAWSLAGRFPVRCAGLVLVDGIPMPRTPGPLLRLGHTRVGFAIMRWGVARLSYDPDNLAHAFAEPSAAPREMRAMLSDPRHPIVSRFTAILIEGDGGPPPRVAPLLLWGAEDRLLGTRLADARRLHEKLPGSELSILPEAGHFPQLEAPERFVETLERYAKRLERSERPDAPAA